MEIEPEIPQHDKTPNLKLVMNPEGKLHDWTDMPEEEVPEMAQIAMVGNPEIAQTLVSGLNDGKGRGKVYHPQTEKQQESSRVYNVAPPSFAGSFRQVFDSRRGMFETPGNRPNTTTTQLVRSKTLPDIPQLKDENDHQKMNNTSLKRAHKASSPVVPKRSSSKQMVAMLSTADGNNSIHRRPLRSFFCNAS